MASAVAFRVCQVLSKAKVGSLGRQLRCMSALVNVEKQGNIAILELNRGPVNSFSLDFLREINAELDKVEVDQDCKGLIVTSGLSKVFSAGLDLVKEVYKPADERRLASFWQEFQGMWLRLYGSRLVTMAAINGHALAGGCVLGLACDYRIMADGPRIGLVETEAGVPPPFCNDAAQEGRTESLQWRLWHPLYGPCVTLEHSSQPAGISCMLVFGEGRKPENPEKNPQSREENPHKLNPLVASTLGHIGGRRVLSPLRVPCSPNPNPNLSPCSIPDSWPYVG
ncbi:enoyl-CoA delta isomerase 1, mitochondrial-like isoform X2 [Montipora foliosa]|uniref:enoyl-CoA delta isomerase 1, mitochondrial-like isoform X2 n=1 Tax=Montipora foliosa TaxID=591990 RepID=UPI0035F1B53B